MIRNKDIIIVGLQAWDNEIGSNCINIAREFARHNRVLYVNYPTNRRTLLRDKEDPLIAKRIDLLKNKKENLLPVAPNIWNLYPACVIESINWVPFTPLFRLFNRINNRRYAREIRKAVKRLGFRDYILFNDSDMFRSFHLKELLRPALSIYYTRDNLVAFPYFQKHGRRMEPELVAKSDLVVANSTYLAGLAGRYNRHAYYVGQGCEVEDFDMDKVGAAPADMAALRRPVIGYIGVLFKLRLNLEMLEQLAAQRKEWSLVLIGPEDDDFKNSSLHRMDNVHFLGLKEARELPTYLARFDVAINPQFVNEITIGNYPRKIDEYLAMGKPVVATRTEAMSIFADHVYFATTTEEYSAQIQKALEEDTPERRAARTAFARSHTWENSVEAIYQAMTTVQPALARP